jgi:ankyrin repeat protein
MEQDRIVNKLIEGGSDVNAPNTDQQLPVHRATLRGNKKLVDALLAAGAKGLVNLFLQVLKY